MSAEPLVLLLTLSPEQVARYRHALLRAETEVRGLVPPPVPARAARQWRAAADRERAALTSVADALHTLRGLMPAPPQTDEVTD